LSAQPDKNQNAERPESSYSEKVEASGRLFACLRARKLEGITKLVKSCAIVIGARPNFMKAAPIYRQMAASTYLRPLLVHTGQHYDDNLSGNFFRDLGIPTPDINLEVGSASHSVQTARVMMAFDQILESNDVAAVLVVGDVNSTLAAALVATKRNIPVIHVEAGLRSFDRTMPEEINRVLTDQMSELLFVTEDSGVDNLIAEGISREKIHLVGNVMIDSLLHARAHAIPARTTIARALETAGRDPVDIENYSLLTLHRPSNVDDADIFKALFAEILEFSRSMPVVFPVHPRTRAALARIDASTSTHPGLIAMEPVSYFEMLGLLEGADLVLTDSGGLQEESSALGIPCLTLRENTERPITVSLGTNQIIGNSPNALRKAVARFHAGERKIGAIPPLWDGRTAERIVQVVNNWI
jgi:UDP-N-acetylglucosamine 2-epimerase (non-hydrolysing)